ncbi:Ubiquitin-like domain-containing protein CIP73 [Sesamum alatum]|uniref:Ubiquitin-like domain-containing protein CIP73 n=1 Tax=Sesamum alatum TaxID=300844 RepID=A0AAE1YQR2_9LAMI|nr:Ubiquitin-like domain-containing protein CIP73 [Sesamum alatum]
MANLQPSEGPSASDVSGQSSESTLQLNIKTLDSRICSFYVDKNIVISAFKEKIASETGVPVGQQRLIFRGKVLNDDHLLSEYIITLYNLYCVYLKNITYVENGDTLHLVERQHSTGSNSGEATSGNGNRVQDSTVGGPRNRIGQIPHSVVLGTLNVGDAGEVVAPDLSRVIGAVLNSIGIGNMAGGIHPRLLISHGNETEGSQVIVGSQSHGEPQSVPWQALHGQSASYPVQTRNGAAIAVPSLNMPIPDSLNTITDFMNRMQLAFPQNDTQQNQSPSASGNIPTSELPTNSGGYPTVEALTIVLQHAQRLLHDHAIPALSHTAGRLDQEGASNDPAVRGQVQTEAVQLGVAMQHLGALLLELGRTILTLRLGQSPGESFVNAGPAVYISSSGPNPIMVQPFPLQTSSLFGGSPSVELNPVAMSPVGVGNVPRNVNIHIHTGASLASIVSTAGNRAPNVEEVQGVRLGGTDSGEIGAQLRSLAANWQNEGHAESEGYVNQEQLGRSRGDDTSSHQSSLTSSRIGETSQTLPHVTIMDDQKAQTQPSTRSKEGPYSRSITSEHAESLEGLSRSNQGNDNPDGSSGIPLGLGLGGLQPKSRDRQPRVPAKNSDGASSSTQKQKPGPVGQQVLQSRASHPPRGDGKPPHARRPSDTAKGAIGSAPTARQNAYGHTDVADAMSQFLHNPSLDDLLAGVSQQTGVGSPDMLRNMLQQFTQNPAMRSTVNQIAQQIDSHDLGSMFSGLDNRGQGGGVDLSRMMQQMMPIVSQALGDASSISQLNPSSGPVLSGSSSRRSSRTTNDHPQIDLRQVVQRLEDQSSSEEIFRSLVDRAVHLSSGGRADERIVNQLCSRRLSEEFVEMLHHDISQRLHDEMGS